MGIIVCKALCEIYHINSAFSNFIVQLKNKHMWRENYNLIMTKLDIDKGVTEVQ